MQNNKTKNDFVMDLFWFMVSAVMLGLALGMYAYAQAINDTKPFTWVNGIMFSGNILIVVGLFIRFVRRYAPKGSGSEKE